jgi:hypothetical protein
MALGLTIRQSVATMGSPDGDPASGWEPRLYDGGQASTPKAVAPRQGRDRVRCTTFC